MGKHKVQKGVAQSVHRCDLCDFSTKNIYIFKRHRVRCKRDKFVKVNTLATSSVNVFPAAPSETGLEVPAFVASAEETGLETQAFVANAEERNQNNGESAGDIPKKKPTYKKTYRCISCGFVTTKSKLHLYHQILIHKEVASIFGCDKCEYCSKYKRKVQNHMHMVHKIFVEMSAVTKEYDPKSGPPTDVNMSEISGKFSTVSHSPILSSALSAAKSSNAIDHIVEMSMSPGCVKYRCKYCLFNSTSRDAVLHHVQSNHANMMNAKQFRCSQCNYVTTKKIEFIAHKAEHGTVTNEYAKPVAEPTEHRCGECDYTTYSKLDYDEHKRAHDNEVMPYQCNVCGFSSDSELAMVRHMSSAHIDNADGVEIIMPRAPEDDMDSSMDMDYQNNLNISNEDSLNYTLDSSAASAEFDSAQSSREGTPNMRRDDFSTLLGKLQTADGNFFCPLCGLKYKRSSDLNRHMKLKHNMRMRQYLLQMKEEEEQSGTTTLEERPFGVFSGCEVYMEHEVKEETSDLQCHYCPYQASSLNDFRQHVATHQMESRFQCPVCDKHYKYIGDLHVHLRLDHQVDPESVQINRVPSIPNKKSSPSMFNCPSCSFQTQYKAEMDKHSKVHRDTKPFKCNTCNYESHWKGDLKRHVYKHHPEIMTDDVTLEDVITIDLEKLRGQKSHTVTGPSQYEDNDEYVDTSSTSFDDGNSSFGRNSSERSRSVTPMKDAGGLNIFHCDYCSFQTNAPSKLNAHVSTHVNLKIYMCPTCGRRANWKWDIRKHIKKEHPNCTLDVIRLSRQEAQATIKSYIDTMPVVRREHHLNCDVVTAKPKPVEEDSQSQCSKNKNYMCASCGFRSNVRGNVNRHIKALHPGKSVDLIFVPDDVDEQEDLVKTGIIIPPYAPKPNPQDSSMHVPVSLPNTSGGVDKPYMCAECGKRCSIKADVRKHYHYIHPTSEIKILFVEENGTTLLPVEDTKTKPPSAMERASAKLLAGDADFKPFKCGEPNCGRTTNSKGDIKRHYTFVHPGKEVNIISLINNKKEEALPESTAATPPSSTTTSSSPQLSSANPKVFGYIKPFKCSKCGHRSNWKWDLGKHIRSKHPNESPEIITMSEAEARATYKDYMSGVVQPQTEALKKIKSIGTMKQEKILKIETLKRSSCRQFKCSSCPYRSNWRSDLMRHIKRKHGSSRAKVQVLDVEEAKQSLTEYDYKPKKGRNPIEMKHKLLGRDEKKESGRIWKCAKCTYRHKDKFAVINHLSSHGVKAYKCSVCGYATNYRSSAYRHIKGKHNSDNISLCRVSIKYIKEDQTSEEPVYKRQKKYTDVSMDTANTESDDADFDATEAEPNSFIDTYRCTLCNFKANWRSSVCRHIRNSHNTNDYTGLLEGSRRYFSGESKPLDIICLSSEKKDKNETKSQSVSSDVDEDDYPEKKYRCNICPYRTAKPNLLKFHYSCHTPQPGVEQEKCKFCPYYVVAKRLLHQHMRLHMQDMHVRQKEASSHTSATPVKKSSIFHSASPSSGTPKRYKCNNCPYMSNSKNDMLYHKQFHRHRASCDYKCEHCEYWVTHRRLLRQHMKVHDINPSPARSNSVQSSPCKSDMTESSVLHDTVQLAMYKQRMISAKIVPSISQKPVMSPMKIACSVGNRPGYALKNGVYRKMHKCKKCPYMNLRLRNLRLHELMHNNRKSKNPLQKCPHCDYSVGSKGLLSHHLKVHQPGYMVDVSDNAAAENEAGLVPLDDDGDSDEGNSDITMESKADTLFEIAKFKKYSCEKCPYASAKRSHYERHVALHGSKQRCQCLYCDYSVPSNNLLAQHTKLHRIPNQNLLAVQSLSNLQLLEEVPADVALASALPPLDKKGSFTVSITHDHLDLYENSPELDIEPKKLYRCDRCPYANVRRDHLLAHLKFHMIKSELVCPYCDYSVAKQHLLTQHIRVHFCPLPELSNWLAKNGEMDRVKRSKDPDISEALFVAELFRTDGCGKDKEQAEEKKSETEQAEEKTEPKTEPLNGKNEETKTEQASEMDSAKKDDMKEKSEENSREKDENGISERNEEAGEKVDEYVCQYCDREFSSSDLLMKHEMQHLIGNNFEEYMSQIQQLAEVSDGEEEAEEEEDEDVFSGEMETDKLNTCSVEEGIVSSADEGKLERNDEMNETEPPDLVPETEERKEEEDMKESTSASMDGTETSVISAHDGCSDERMVVDDDDDGDDEISFKKDDESMNVIEDVTEKEVNESEGEKHELAEIEADEKENLQD